MTKRVGCVANLSLDSDLAETSRREADSPSIEKVNKAKIVQTKPQKKTI